jgi:hypothetical protein
MHVAEFGVRSEPMPVPRVMTMTTPPLPFPAPNSISAMAAASASLNMWNDNPVRFSKSASASVPIHDLSTLAALSATPRRTIAGNVHPTVPVASKWRTISATTSATMSGVDGSGVSIL